MIRIVLPWDIKGVQGRIGSCSGGNELMKYNWFSLISKLNLSCLTVKIVILSHPHRSYYVHKFSFYSFFSTSIWVIVSMASYILSGTGTRRNWKFMESLVLDRGLRKEPKGLSWCIEGCLKGIRKKSKCVA